MLQMQAKEDKDAQQLSEEREKRGYPGGPAVKNPPCNAGDVTPHAAEQLSPGKKKVGIGKERPSSRDFRRNMPFPAPCFQTSSLQNHDRTHLHCMKPPSLRSLVTAARVS